MVLREIEGDLAIFSQGLHDGPSVVALKTGVVHGPTFDVGEHRALTNAFMGPLLPSRRANMSLNRVLFPYQQTSPSSSDCYDSCTLRL